MTVLSDSEVSARLEGLAGWTGDSASITKSYKFVTFMEAIAFVNRVAAIAEERNHHPDIDIRWTTVTMTLSTHSEGGVTDKDLELAAAIERAASPRG